MEMGKFLSNKIVAVTDACAVCYESVFTSFVGMIQSVK